MKAELKEFAANVAKSLASKATKEDLEGILDHQKRLIQQSKLLESSSIFGVNETGR